MPQGPPFGPCSGTPILTGPQPVPQGSPFFEKDKDHLSPAIFVFSFFCRSGMIPRPFSRNPAHWTPWKESQGFSDSDVMIVLETEPGSSVTVKCPTK